MISVSEYLYSVALLFTQGLVNAAPTLLVGVVIAGALRGVVGPDRLRGLFRGSTAARLGRASLLATLTPVCSLGVLPIVREMRSAGVPVPCLLTYALSAPMLNPITLVYGWTVLEPAVFFLLVGVTLLVSWGVGAVTQRWATRKVEVRPEEWPRGGWGLPRMGNLGMAAARITSGRAPVDLALTLGVAGVVGSLFTPGWLTEQMPHTNAAAPLAMLLVAPSAYVDPYFGLMQVWAIASVQFSLAAAVVLHVFGVGMNAAVAVWIGRLFGLRRFVSLVMILLVISLGVGYAANALLLQPVGSEQQTHALDSLTRPYGAYAVGMPGAGWFSLWSTATRWTPPAFLWSLGAIGLLAAAGAGLRLAKVPYFTATADSLSPSTSPEAAAVWNRAIPASWLAAIGVAGLLVSLVLLLYVYYPPPGEIFEEMHILRTNAVIALKTGDGALADRELHKLDAYLRKLPTSMTLRGNSMTEAAEQAQSELRKLILQLRDHVHAGHVAQARELTTQLFDASVACRTASLQGAP